MTDEPDATTPLVDVELLVRKPAAEVWQAFADPEQMTRFWLGGASGPMEPGAELHWVFKVAGAEADVLVAAAEPGRLLDWNWDDGQRVRATFDERNDGTLVRIRVSGFTGDEAAANAVDASSGFTLVLASLKQYLEHGVEGDLMYDRFPDADYSDRP